jgi:hypothetical protein
VPREVDSIPVADGSHCIKGAAASAEVLGPISGKAFLEVAGFILG